PWILILAYFFYMRRKIQGQMGGGMMGRGGIFGIGKSRARKFRREKISVTFNDVAGLENAKADLKEIIVYLKNPEKFSKLGADIPNGILLMGPPGTGKTLLAKATAGEAEVSFFSISGSEFIEMFVGVGASRVRDLFSEAKKNAPSVIFIDEIDSIGRSRGTGLGGGHDEREQTLNQILNEMDGFEKNESIVVLAATNRPDVLDPALVRPGRFDRRVTLDLPLKTARKKILEIHTREVPVGDDVDLENIAARTVGFSGADLKNLVNEAALFAGREKKDKVEKSDFEKARDKIILGSETDEMIDEDEKKLVAYHEAGHALVALLMEEADPLEKVTIIPRGRTLGITEQMPEIERRNYRKKYLMAKIAVALGGRASEKIVFNDVSNGAANDFKQVTNLARKMVCLWGMSDKLGPVFYKQGEEHQFLGKEITRQKDFSEHTQQIIDDEIKEIILDMEKKAEYIIKKNRVKLDALAEALIENETLDKKQIDWILDKVEEGEEAVVE
ncbi:MAG TPA: ATP-dependent zinc metalloprotease FtsH, partial [Salinimicrobium catena]|nr:ATP-dependent zinc metalloprotease FtsH [Salinimicrobium catena]